MKSLSFFLFFTLCVTSKLHSQTVNGKPLSEINVEYILVEINLHGSFTGKCRVTIDYGQEKTKTISLKNTFTLQEDKNNEDMYFNTHMHAINYICQFGYEVINVMESRDSILYGERYLLKKVKKQ